MTQKSVHVSGHTVLSAIVGRMGYLLSAVLNVLVVVGLELFRESGVHKNNEIILEARERYPHEEGPLSERVESRGWKHLSEKREEEG